MRPLLNDITEGRLDPTFIISHRLKLDDAPRGYDMFMHKEDDCTKVVLAAT
jgi:threonine dehydrogenase-like Zn-dependent dehydrogenase